MNLKERVDMMAHLEHQADDAAVVLESAKALDKQAKKLVAQARIALAQELRESNLRPVNSYERFTIEIEGKTVLLETYHEYGTGVQGTGVRTVDRHYINS